MSKNLAEPVVAFLQPFVESHETAPSLQSSEPIVSSSMVNSPGSHLRVIEGDQKPDSNTIDSYTVVVDKEDAWEGQGTTPAVLGLRRRG